MSFRNSSCMQPATLNMISSVRLYLLLLPPYPAQTLIFSSLVNSVRHKCAVTFLIAISFLLLSLLNFFHIFTNIKFVHVTSTYYHS